MNKNTPRKPYVSPDTNVTAVALESAICDGSVAYNVQERGITTTDQNVNTDFMTDASQTGSAWDQTDNDWGTSN